MRGDTMIHQSTPANNGTPHGPRISYSLNEAVRVSSLSKSTLYRHNKAGQLRLIRVGGRTLVDARSLHALLGIGPGDCGAS